MFRWTSLYHESTKDHEEHEGRFVLKCFVIFVPLRDFVKKGTTD
jgi:hypothetical protein